MLRCSVIVKRVDDENADGVTEERLTKKEEQERLGISRPLLNGVMKQKKTEGERTNLYTYRWCSHHETAELHENWCEYTSHKQHITSL